MAHPGFLRDITPLLRPGVEYDPQKAFRVVKELILPLV